MIQFSNIVYFWFAALFSILLLLLNFFTMKRIGRFKKRDIFRGMMWSGVVLFLGMALAGARMNWEKRVPIKEKMEIIFGMDVSLSSLAKDVEIQNNGEVRKISRLEMEKQQVENVIGRLEGDAVGIIAFAAQAIPLQYVLSREDYQDAVIRNLRYIDGDFVRYQVMQGTDYGILILTALKQFNENKKSGKILFILTDGEPQGDENKLRENLSKALEKFSDRKDIGIFLVGVGNSAEPSKIPEIEDKDGNPLEYYVHEDGEPVLTRPNPEFLTNLANATGGYYIHAGSGKNLENILADLIEQKRRIIGWEKKNQPVDLTPYLLISSLILLFAIPVIKSV